jgi:hypothetical protein
MIVRTARASAWVLTMLAMSVLIAAPKRRQNAAPDTPIEMAKRPCTHMRPQNCDGLLETGDGLLETGAGPNIGALLRLGAATVATNAGTFAAGTAATRAATRAALDPQADLQAGRAERSMDGDAGEWDAGEWEGSDQSTSDTSIIADRECEEDSAADSDDGTARQTHIHTHERAHTHTTHTRARARAHTHAHARARARTHAQPTKTTNNIAAVLHLPPIPVPPRAPTYVPSGALHVPLGQRPTRSQPARVLPLQCPPLEGRTSRASLPEQL